jgi:hypothetical protein
VAQARNIGQHVRPRTDRFGVHAYPVHALQRADLLSRFHYAFFTGMTTGQQFEPIITMIER